MNDRMTLEEAQSERAMKTRNSLVFSSITLKADADSDDLRSESRTSCRALRYEDHGWMIEE